MRLTSARPLNQCFNAALSRNLPLKLATNVFFSRLSKLDDMRSLVGGRFRPLSQTTGLGSSQPYLPSSPKEEPVWVQSSTRPRGRGPHFRRNARGERQGHAPARARPLTQSHSRGRATWRWLGRRAQPSPDERICRNRWSGLGTKLGHMRTTATQVLMPAQNGDGHRRLQNARPDPSPAIRQMRNQRPLANARRGGEGGRLGLTAWRRIIIPKRKDPSATRKGAYQIHSELVLQVCIARRKRPRRPRAPARRSRASSPPPPRRSRARLEA